MDYCNSHASDLFYRYIWRYANGKEIPIRVTTRNTAEARVEGLKLLEQFFNPEKTLDIRNIIENTEAILVGPYTGWYEEP
jgi:hypothetical protein